MKKEYKIAIVLAVVALAVWFFVQQMPSGGVSKQSCARPFKQKAKGAVWQRGVVMAPAADDGNAFPAANVL